MRYLITGPLAGVDALFLVNSGHDFDTRDAAAPSRCSRTFDHPRGERRELLDVRVVETRHEPRELAFNRLLAATTRSVSDSGSSRP
jgi:hypothetical protein